MLICFEDQGERGQSTSHPIRRCIVPTKCRKCKVPVRFTDAAFKCPKCEIVFPNAHLGAVLVDIPIWPDQEVEEFIRSRKDTLLGALELGLPPDKEPELCSYCPNVEVCQPGIQDED